MLTGRHAVVPGVLGGPRLARDGALVAAGALVAEGTVVPADCRAVGVPARVREGAGTAEFVEMAVALYVQNARRYRDGLTRIG